MAKKLKRERELRETQITFRPLKGTIDAVYLPKTMIRKRLRKESRNEIGRMVMEQETTYVHFADLKVAFDNVDRKEIVRMMGEVELGELLGKLVGGAHGVTKSRIVVGDGYKL